MVFPAFFLILLAEELRDRQAAAVVVAGGLIALALVPFAPPGIPVVAACAAALAIKRQSSAPTTQRSPAPS